MFNISIRARLKKLKERYSMAGIIRHTLKIEKGYVDNPNDTGGKTRWGITEKLALDYKNDWSNFNFHGEMYKLPVALALYIYEQEFWNKMRLGMVIKISPLLADKMFDWGVNAGRAAPILALQNYLNCANRMERDWKDLKPDGGYGRITNDALSAYVRIRGEDGVKRLLMYMNSEQTVNYRLMTDAREKNEEFFNGWMDRASDYMYDVAKLIDDGWFEDVDDIKG